MDQKTNWCIVSQQPFVCQSLRTGTLDHIGDGNIGAVLICESIQRERIISFAVSSHVAQNYIFLSPSNSRFTITADFSNSLIVNYIRKRKSELMNDTADMRVPDTSVIASKVDRG